MDRFLVLDPIKIVSATETYSLQSYLIHPDPRAIALTHIGDRNDVFDAISRIEEKIRPQLVTQLAYALPETYRFITAMAELCQNIYYHSIQRGGYRGYIAMHATANNLRFIALDLGPGIPNTLKPRYAFTSDAEAICLSIQPGVTSRPHGGLGLHRTLQIVKQAGGAMIIRSGLAAVHFDRDDTRIRNTSQFASRRMDIWGTQIGIQLPKKQ